MKRWIALLIAATSLAVCPGEGQTLDETFAFAEQQLAAGEDHAAEKAFKRVIFFDRQARHRARCVEALAYLSEKKGELTEALNYLDQAYYLTTDEQRQFDYQIRRVQIYLQTNQWQRALAEVYQLDDSYAQERALLYEGYCQYMLRDFEAAAGAFDGLLTSEMLSKHLAKARRIETLNPKFYQTMSYILPGSGQILLGDVKESLNSLLLNGGLAALFIHTANRLSFFDAVLSVVPWFYRYYAGGAKLTKTLAMEKKAKRHRENLAEMVQAIQEKDP